jgi:thiosulfate dehydrogenase
MLNTWLMSLARTGRAGSNQRGEVIMNARTILAAGLAALVTVAVSAQAQERSAAAWTVPEIGTLPDDKFGKMVRLGRELVERTYAHLGPEVVDPAKRYAGNNLSCNTCHLDAGARKFGNPFIGASADFPQYRPREDAIGTIEDRINGCMERSMNGRKLPVDSQEMKAMSAYMKFMSTGVPVGARIEGRGTLKMKLLDRAADPVAGRDVYTQYCTSCHGADATNGL